MSPTRILGIGSPFGDDQAGWRVVEALERRREGNGFAAGKVSLIPCDRPGAGLLASLRGARLAILVDAVQSGAAPGTIHRLEPLNLADGAKLLSSHGFGPASALALAEALSELPDEVIVYGLEIGEAETATPSGPLTETVAKAVDELASIIADELMRRERIGSLHP